MTTTLRLAARAAGWIGIACVAAPAWADAPPHDGWVLERVYGSLDLSAELSFRCNAIAVGPTGDVFSTTADDASRIFQVSPTGQILRVLQHNGLVNGLAVYNNFLFIGTDTIAKYNLTSGQFEAFPPTPLNPTGIAIPHVATNGTVFVTDTVDIFDFGVGGTGLIRTFGIIPEFGDYVRGVALGSFADGNLIINRTAQYSVFTPGGQFVRNIANPSTAAASVSAANGFFYTSQPLRIYNAYGDRLGELPVPAGFTFGLQSAIGPNSSIYTCTDEPGTRHRIFKYRPAYRTVSTLVGAGAVPFSEVAQAKPRPGTTLLDVDYVIRDADSGSVTAAPLALIGGSFSIDAARRVSTLVEGTASNIGTGVTTGAPHRITWDVSADLSGAPFAQAKIVVLANDGRGLVDIHYITLPANIPNNGDPVLIISDTPITDPDMLNAWMWLLARNDPEVGLSGGNLVKVGGADAGTVFASGTATTVAGRAYLFARLNVHEATAAEVTRAKMGTTLGEQQYEPLKRVGTRPVKINEVGFDTGAASGYWVVKN